MTGGTYKGISRDKIDWFPTVDRSKCTNCGTCAENCPHQTYDWDGKPVVARPYNCVVGCTGCANNCPEGAISFPTLAWLAGELKRLKEASKLPDPEGAGADSQGWKFTLVNEKERE